jgi:hypothetical protein
MPTPSPPDLRAIVAEALHQRVIDRDLYGVSAENIDEAEDAIAVLAALSEHVVPRSEHERVVASRGLPGMMELAAQVDSLLTERDALESSVIRLGRLNEQATADLAVRDTIIERLLGGWRAVPDADEWRMGLGIGSSVYPFEPGVAEVLAVIAGSGETPNDG